MSGTLLAYSFLAAVLADRPSDRRGCPARSRPSFCYFFSRAASFWPARHYLREQFMQAAGDVNSATVIHYPDGRSKGWGLVNSNATAHRRHRQLQRRGAHGSQDLSAKTVRQAMPAAACPRWLLTAAGGGKGRAVGPAPAAAAARARLSRSRRRRSRVERHSLWATCRGPPPRSNSRR